MRVDSSQTVRERVSGAAGRDDPRSGARDITTLEEDDGPVTSTEQNTTADSLQPLAVSSQNEIPASTSSHTGLIPLAQAVTVTLSPSNEQASASPAPAKKPERSSLSSSSPHACSACHLYAPSSSATFYLDAWLNQQNDILSATTPHAKPKSKKRVSWPSATAQLKTVIDVNKWIEKCIHVHPHPTPRSERRLDETQDGSQDEDYEERVKACRKEEGRASVLGGPYSEYEAAVRIRGVDPIKHRAMIENFWKRPLDETDGSEDEDYEEQRAKACGKEEERVSVIGGPYSEYEAAVRIRGVDPIKHRPMIENYWQY